MKKAAAPPKKAVGPPPPPLPPGPPAAPPVFDPSYPLTVLFYYDPSTNRVVGNTRIFAVNDADIQHQRRMEAFKRTVKDGSNTLKYDENLAEKTQWAMQYPENYLTARTHYHNETYGTLQTAYYEFVQLFLAAGDPEDVAYQKATSSLYNIRKYCDILMNNQFPDKATQTALRIQHIKSTGARLERISNADNGGSFITGNPLPDTALSDAIKDAIQPTLNFQNLIGRF